MIQVKRAGPPEIRRSLTGHWQMTASTKVGVGSSREDRPGDDPTAPRLDLALMTALPILGRIGQPAGMVLRLEPLPLIDGECFEILVAGEDGGTLMRLGPFPEEEVVAVWRALGASSGLPLVIEDAGGERETPFPQIGRVQLGAVRIRRRHGLLSGRRPRFSTRRKTGRLPLQPQVFREREMFAGSPVHALADQALALR